MGWQLGDDEAMRERIRREYQAIHRHLTRDARREPFGDSRAVVRSDVTAAA
jgi:hypothetical protein